MALLADVRGRVLELGVRGGPNFPFYRPGTQVVATDLDAQAMQGARKAFPRFDQGLALSQADAQRLPFADQSFDAVVATLVFCTIPDPALALGEVARVLQPGGRLYTIDHVRAAPRALGAVMDALAPVWKFMSGGDHLNRRTEEFFRASGFRIRQRRTTWLGILLWLVMDPPE
jgi:SAM-dependent methyltransferase